MDGTQLFDASGAAAKIMYLGRSLTIVTSFSGGSTLLAILIRSDMKIS